MIAACMLTNRTKYAIKALLHLARHRGQGRVRAAEIASAERIPPKFLETILLELRNKGIVRSQVGKGGGHELAREPAEVSLLSIIRAIEGPAAPLPCLSRTAYARCDDCPNEDSCGARRLMGTVYNQSLMAMENTTLADAAADAGDQPRPPAKPPSQRRG